ncbi:hypothetical protein HQ560_17805 [bacterium]|nr:hypothetical protein [bacterium]
MIKIATTLILALALPWSCRRAPEPDPEPAPKPPPVVAPVVEPPPVEVGPLDRRGTFDFDGVRLPAVISRIGADTGVEIGVAPSIPVEDWSRRGVSLVMKDVALRDFLDWLARIARAEYVLASDGTVWLTRGDQLLMTERLEVRAVRVPTHFNAPAPVYGRLDYSKEQKLIVTLLKDCLRYLLDRRPGCRLAFHGEQDVLASRLPARGQSRVEAILHAIRNGTPKPEPAKPSADEIVAALEKAFECDWPPAKLNDILRRASEAAGVNVGWDSGSLAPPTVVIPKGRQNLVSVLKLIIRQTPFGRYKVEPGRGVWLYLAGRTVDFPYRRAVVWDRMVVRAYNVGRLMGSMSPEGLLDELKRRVDPGKWDRGFPAIGFFPPTGVVVVLHDEEGHPRIAAALRGMGANAPTPRMPKEPE